MTIHISEVLSPILDKINEMEDARLLKAMEDNKPEWLEETQYELFNQALGSVENKDYVA